MHNEYDEEQWKERVGMPTVPLTDWELVVDSGKTGDVMEVLEDDIYFLVSKVGWNAEIPNEAYGSLLKKWILKAITTVADEIRAGK